MFVQTDGGFEMSELQLKFGELAIDRKTVDRAKTVLGMLDTARTLNFDLLAFLMKERSHRISIPEIRELDILITRMEDFLERSGK